MGVTAYASGPTGATGLRGGLDADAVLPVGDDEPEEGGDEDGLDTEMEAMKDGLEAGIGVPGSACLLYTSRCV